MQVSIKGYEAVYCLKLLLNYTSAVFPLGLNSNRVVPVLMSLHIGHEKGMICFCRLNFKKVQYAHAGTDPEIFDGGWLSGWLPVLYYTK